MELAGTVIIVTGASRGLGAATAELLGREEATVVCVGRDGPALERVAARCGGSTLVADVGDPAAAERIVGATLARHGRLDGVVLNAGVGHVGPVAAMTPEQITELIDVDVRAPLLLAAAVAAELVRTHTAGAVVFVGSIAGAVGVPGESVYSAAKAALAAFAPLLGEELAATGTTVSTVVPGVVDTALLTTRAEPYTRRHPRPLPPQRVALEVVRALVEGPRQERFVPGWLAVPARLSALAPRTYRRLAARFG